MTSCWHLWERRWKYVLFYEGHMHDIRWSFCWLLCMCVCVCVDSINMGKIAGHVDAEQPNGKHLPCFLAAWHLNLLPIYKKSTPGRANPSPTRIRKCHLFSHTYGQANLAYWIYPHQTLNWKVLMNKKKKTSLNLCGRWVAAAVTVATLSWHDKRGDVHSHE